MKRLSILAIIILAIFFSALFFTFNNNQSSKYAVNLSSETVIKQVQSLNRLETASYTIEKVIDESTPGNKLQQMLFGDRILLIAHGQAIAGFDMSKISDNDVDIANDNLTLHLPAPQILVTTLDNDQTRVYNRQTGLLTKGDQNLESDARKEAEAVIKDAACKGGILDEATKNAKNQLTSLFKSVGFQSVIIDVPKGSC